MEIVVGILVIIIAGLLFYLFMVNKELRRIGNELDVVLKSDSNQLLHEKLTNREISEILNKFNDMISQIREKEISLERRDNRLKKEITNITHDLRTPLTSSLGYINLILNSDMTKEEQLEELKIVETRLLRLQELVSTFFEYSMITASGQNVTLEATNLVAVVEECITRYYDDFIAQQKKIGFNCPAGKCIFNSNSEMLKRIVDNLIGNALKYSVGDLNIDLSVEQSDNDEKKEMVILTFSNEVLDTDIDVENIFDEFYTSDISRTKGSTGLGLAIVKEFTNMLGGKISAKIEREQLVIEIKFVK
ncbi:MAG: HAMP domain-containing histidine kinase [Lachnospiraceae bacterium]|nr:HAMP domain-containing histidine kinase [Lachnospiraceae bacterium]